MQGRRTQTHTPNKCIVVRWSSWDLRDISHLSLSFRSSKGDNQNKIKKKCCEKRGTCGVSSSNWSKAHIAWFTNDGIKRDGEKENHVWVILFFSCTFKFVIRCLSETLEKATKHLIKSFIHTKCTHLSSNNEVRPVCVEREHLLRNILPEIY